MNILKEKETDYEFSEVTDFFKSDKKEQTPYNFKNIEIQEISLINSPSILHKNDELMTKKD